MDNIAIGKYIRSLRKEKGLTQKELAERLCISYQAVSKWENGETLPDVSLLGELSDILEVSIDRLLNGGKILMNRRKAIRYEDVVKGFEAIEEIGRCFGENSDFYRGMVEGIDRKMNIDLEEYLGDPRTREVMYAEAIIQAILDGKTVDMEEMEASFTNKKMVKEIGKYLEKTK